MNIIFINIVVLFAGVLLLIGIASSKFSTRLGMPVLVLFLGVGMLAGSEGLGRIPFEDYGFANSVGSVALALILFDGGLRTSLASVRSAWGPALSLSTVGVLLTSALTGLAAAWALNMPLLHGLLLGGIVGSTDAAAVFSILRTSKLKMPDRLRATLEVESGSNDPMAIFLTVGLIEVITGRADAAGGLALLFVLQFGVGALVGISIGRSAAWVVNRINLDHSGLYPILALAFGLLAYGLAAVLQGSGFLAVYLTGIVLGNRLIVFRRGIFLFHDAAAWLGQIVLFVMLGLLSFPSRLATVAMDGLVLAIVLIFVARPLAVAASAFPFRFRPKEMVFLAWVGLKGAVPITLATFPLMAGVTGGELIFNVVFFVVLISALTQGWSLPTVARWLGIAQPAALTPPLSVEVNTLRHVDGEILDYTVAPSAHVAGRMLSELALPDGMVVALLVRDDKVIMPRGSTVLRPGDHAFVAMQRQLKPLVDCLFDPEAETPSLPHGFTLTFPAQRTVGQIHHFWGIPSSTWSTEPVGELLKKTSVDQTVRLGPFLVTASDDPSYVKLIYTPEPTTTNEQHAKDAESGRIDG